MSGEFKLQFKNPYRPGAGHMPPHLAGRDPEITEFQRLLAQDIILENLVLTGLRGVGKTVLLERLKPIALKEGWLWVGTDMSESASLSEENIATRLLADLSVTTSSIQVEFETERRLGFSPATPVTNRRSLDFDTLAQFYSAKPGLTVDKLKNVLETVWEILRAVPPKGIIFAYDEAQNLSDHAGKEQFPLSLLLDTFQSIQKKEIPFMLALTGLPTLFPKLVESRTFSERMFRVLFLDRLSQEASKEAILKPIEKENCPVKFNEGSVETIIRVSGGYPYFIQFICREIYDVFIQQAGRGEEPRVPIESIIRKLDTDFFAGRWSRATDRQRELLLVIAKLENSDNEFTVHDIVEQAKELEKPFSSSHVNQMLAALSDTGLVYKNRHGKYSFAVPLLGNFIRRQMESPFSTKI